MAVSISVIDSVNYPDNAKTVSVDIKSLVDAGSDGDELWFLVASTSARATGNTSIDDELASYMLNGYSKTSGLTSPPYIVESGTNYLQVSIDGSVVREITVDPGTYSGDAFSDKLEETIRDLAGEGGLEAGNISFKNASVDYYNGRIRIKSGTTSNTFTAAGKSSVAVTDGNTAQGFAAQLGFDMPFESETLATQCASIYVTSVSSTSSSGGTTLNVNNGTNFSAGEALYVTDGTNSEYGIVGTGGQNNLVMKSNLLHTYAAGARVQRVVYTDPDSLPPSPLDTIDKVLTSKISSIVAQIDFAL
jgi:hypothetical protein